MSPPLETVAQLEQSLSEPSPAVIETISRFRGDLLVLGAGGKMGPSLARMAQRAATAAAAPIRVYAASRFSDRQTRELLDADGVVTIASDFFEPDQLAQLPPCPYVLYLTGLKFGASARPELAWVTNSYLPGRVLDQFRRSRVVALSTGNVYGLSDVTAGGSRETDPLRPLGEYAMSCVGRERVIEYFCQKNETPTAIIRLNYAADLRYGVLVDIAKRIWHGEPVDVGMSYFNTVWQGDANRLILQAFDHVAVPPFVMNLTGSGILRTRDVALKLGELMEKPVYFSGTESTMALLANTQRAVGIFGAPRCEVDQLLAWIAAWVQSGKPTYASRTHFESRDGQF
jgi:nucleoside-diphosphate-sugar epimerase